MENLRTKLMSEKVTLGMHISLNDSTITELIGAVGFDYLWIDMEHTCIDLYCLQQHLIAARAAGVSAVIRVPCIDNAYIKPILEMGPDGIVFPQVNSYELALHAVQSCRYPPEGKRGFGPRRAIGFGKIPLQTYLANAERRCVRLLQIEHVDAVADFDRIAKVPGVDGFIIGPCDLAASMGHIGDLRHHDVEDAIRSVIRRAKIEQIPVGVSLGASDQATMEYWKRFGVDLISIAADTDLLFLGASELHKQMARIYL